MWTHLVDDRELRDIRAMQDSQGQAHHLQVLTSRCSGDVARLGSNIIDNRLLQPGDQEMCALVDDLLLDAAQSVEDDRPCSTADVVDGSVEDHRTRRHGDGKPVNVVQTVSRHDG